MNDRPTYRCDQCAADIHLIPDEALWKDIAAMYHDVFDLDLPEPRCGGCVMATLAVTLGRRDAH